MVQALLGHAVIGYESMILPQFSKPFFTLPLLMLITASDLSASEVVRTTAGIIADEVSETNTRFDLQTNQAQDSSEEKGKSKGGSEATSRLRSFD